MVLILNLNTTVDKTIIINDFKVNMVYRPDEIIEVGGGKGINVARVLNTLEIENTVLGFVGGNKTDAILNTFQKERINFIPVPIHGHSRVCTHIIDKTNRTETIINENGPKISKQEIDNFFIMFKKIFTDNIRYLVIAGSQPLGMPNDFYAKLIKIAKKKRVFTMVDTSLKPLSQAIKSQPELIKPNRAELLYLLNKEKLNSKELKQAPLTLYKKYNIQYPIVTIGKAGCLAYVKDLDKTIRVIPPSISKLSTIGSGDSFTAGMVYSFIKEFDFIDSLKMSTAIAAASTLRIGAGQLNKKDINKLYKKVKIT